MTELNREFSLVQTNLDELLNLRMAGEIDADEYAPKKKELRSRQGTLLLQVEAQTRQRDENADFALKAFELSQSVQDRWVTADDDAKHRLLEILCFNLLLDGVSLVPEWRKPFDVLAEGPVLEKSRGDRRLAFPNDVTGVQLLQQAIAHSEEFSADTFFALGAPGS